MASMMNKVQEIQKKVTKVKEEFAEKEITANAGGGTVEATVKDGRVVGIKIKDKSYADDLDLLTDLIIAAVNNTLDKSDSEEAEAMKVATSGLPNIPGLNY